MRAAATRAMVVAPATLMAMPNEDSVITLMGSVAIDHKAFDRKLPGITCDKQLFPD